MYNMNIQYNTILNNNVTISYISVNSEFGGCPIVIIPGAVNSADEVHAALSEHLPAYHIIISLRGRGKSSSPESGYTLSDQASDIQAVIEHEKIQSCVLFGHSIGSTIGIRAAQNFAASLKAFVVGDFPPFYPPYSNTWATQVLAFSEAIDITPTAVNGIAKDAQYTDVLDELNSLSCSIYAIRVSGENSLLRPEDAEKLKELCPQCTVLELEDSGHEMIHDNPKELARMLIEITQQG